MSIDAALLQATAEAITGAKALLAAGKTPSPIADQSRCKACSLVDLCEPEVVTNCNRLKIDASDGKQRLTDVAKSVAF